jgi:hypothetical protein
MVGFEPSIAVDRKLKEQQRLYNFVAEKNAKGYPPHLELVPPIETFTNVEIFQEQGDNGETNTRQLGGIIGLLAEQKFGLATRILSLVLPIPDAVNDFNPSKSFAEIMEHHATSRTETKSKSSIGDLDAGSEHKWYSDAIFAQQSFTGINPTTIELAGKWIPRFTAEAQRQKLEKTMVQVLKDADPSSLFVQDCSYFREAFGFAEKDQQKNIADPGGLFSGSTRWGCAAVTLFQLDAQGKLHPLAIVIDYKGSMERSVTILNKRLNALQTDVDQENDWPWRYAKTCSQASDWIRHELAIHLTNTHLIEEGIIVAARRTLGPDHVVSRLLSPHWEKTLSLKASARLILLPKVIIPLMGADQDQVKRFVRHSYEKFDFQAKYILKDLESRGFPLHALGDIRCQCKKACDTNRAPNEVCTAGCEPQCHQKCDPKFKNYTYARNMKIMWAVLREFVAGNLAAAGYTNDKEGNKKVLGDRYIQDWAEQISAHSGARITNFPELETVDALVDAVTMCIHIACPQHTAVNYLQQYYLSFVANKPPALCEAPPATLATLLKYKEENLIRALPVAKNRDAEWLLAAHLPALLSQTVAQELNLVTYAVNVYRAAEFTKEPKQMAVAKKFVHDLWVLGNTFTVKDGEKKPKPGIFAQHSEELDVGLPRYSVMDPVVTAVSILI